jgi:hypothetical protein
MAIPSQYSELSLFIVSVGEPASRESVKGNGELSKELQLFVITSSSSQQLSSSLAGSSGAQIPSCPPLEKDVKGFGGTNDGRGGAFSTI